LKSRKIIILIPARYASTRFPGKPLAEISGKSLIQRVFENCSKVKVGSYDIESIVVTDDDRIEDHVKLFNGSVIRVDDDVETGSERIHLAYSRNFSDSDVELVVNVQGDEPLLVSKLIQELIEFHLNSKFDIATIVKKMDANLEDFQDINRVKAAFSENTKQCFYFSRSPIPFDRNGINPGWHLHIGVYSYRPQALVDFASASISSIEKIEGLEQLRAIEIGKTIGAIETNIELFGVDTPEDLQKVNEVFNGI
jgi:3-deoxy-manno-octulosonate cytidylyltransferase (CMP-KDO synthetase)